MIPPKRATRATPASTAPESMSPTRTRGRPRRGAAVGAVADDPVRGMATRTRAAIKPSSSAPAAPAKDRGSLTADPVPRKGPPRDAAKGELHIRTSPERGEEDSASSPSRAEQFDEAFEPEQDDGSFGDKEDAKAQKAQKHQEEAAAQVEVEDAPFMCQGIQKLADAAEGIFTKYRGLFNDYRRNAAYMKSKGKDSLNDADKDQLQLCKTQLRFFEMDIGALTSMRDHLIVHKSFAPFLHWLWLDKQMSVDEAAVLKLSLIPTNLATLVDIVYAGAKKDLSEAGKADLKALKILDDNFEELFLGDRLLPLTNAMVDLALDVRQAHLLAALSSASKNSDARKIVYSIFCVELEDPNIEQLKESLKEGPYRPVAGLDNDLVQQRCRARVAGFLKYIADNEVTFANLASHRKRFPAHDVLVSIQTVYDEELSKPIHDARNAWARLQGGATHTGNDAASEQTEEFHDAADQLRIEDQLRVDMDKSSDDEESQPITRVTDAEAARTIFQGAADLRALQDLQQSSPVVPPPSNQQVSASGRLLSVDDAAAPLTSTVSHRRRRSPSSPSSPVTRRKRTHYQVSDGPPDSGGDECGDLFETDNRPFNGDAVREKRRRPVAKEAERITQALGEHLQQNQAFPHATPPMSTSTTIVGGALTQRSELDLHATESSREVASQSRNTLTTAVAITDRNPQEPRPIFHNSAIRRRHPWSVYDEQVLIKSVKRHCAKWSRIQDEDGKLFEHPRDQQAYRDKARLLKTKMLLTDKLLPPGFNFVALGPKEVRDVVRAGKNPNRKETDVDLATGQLTNTDYVPGQAL